MLEVDTTSGQVSKAVYRDETGEALGHVVRSASHTRTFWEGLGIDPVEYACTAADGEFLWRLYSVRRGLVQGLELSMAETDEEAEAWAHAGEDPLWTVGRLGREGMAEPEVTPPQGDPRTLLIRLTHPGERFRVRLDDEAGEQWGSLEPVAGGEGHQLRRWNGQALAEVHRTEHDHTGSEFVLRPLEPLQGDHADLLTLSAFEAIGLAVAVLLG
ncbi:MAG: hypothetical protein AAFX99_25100 [Myxococcota bacterium]